VSIFSDEVKHLEDIIAHHEEKKVRSQAQLQLALILSHYRNPEPDYLRAREALNTYFELVPSARKNDQLRNWSILLDVLAYYVHHKKELEEKLTSEKEYLHHCHIKLDEKEKEIAKLHEKVKELREVIKKLDELYLKIEQKRKNIQ
jgi:vacuolar-type H+-ATPase subunit I/STV1